MSYLHHVDILLMNVGIDPCCFLIYTVSNYYENVLLFAFYCCLATMLVDFLNGI